MKKTSAFPVVRYQRLGATITLTRQTDGSTQAFVDVPTWRGTVAHGEAVMGVKTKGQQQALVIDQLIANATDVARGAE